MSSPFSLLPQTIGELLPKSSKNIQVSFVAVGPILIDALNEGLDFDEACFKARITPTQAVDLLSNPEFIKYVEAYLSIGDISDRAVRLRIAKSILAAQIATGNISAKKRDALDVLNFVNKEMDSKRGVSVNVNVLQNTSVERPYQRGPGTSAVKIIDVGPSREAVQEQFNKLAKEVGYNGSGEEKG